jgi:sucrose-6-phosphate hydrolase SacC (GH32 family)
LHASKDVYTTGLIYSTTGLAVSRDGVHYQWLGQVLEPSDGRWDAYAARITTVLSTDQGFVAFYDGSASEQENYEERTGVAVSSDLVHWNKLSVEGPWLVSPYGRGTLRYIDYGVCNDQLFVYYELARPDGSHELRVNRIREQ